jgi:hypothetical protein
MTQSKRYSLIESATNTIAGLLTSFSIQVLVYPLLDLDVTISQNVIITAVFFLASIIRGYIIRRIFNLKQK